METNNSNTELTYGQKAVGLKFNPSKNSEVDKAKQLFADAIDQLNDLRNKSIDGEKIICCTDAIREIKTAQMWSVKAITHGM